jgi:hypothetical protein
MSYPKSHKAIVESLLKGKFILVGNRLYEIIKENKDFYFGFFDQSFGYILETTKTDFYYLISDESNEKFSRDISIFFAILCYELDKDGKNFMDTLRYSEFDISEIEKYFSNSTYKDVFESNNSLRDLKKFISTLAGRNILERISEEKIMFTPAFKVFTDFAIDITKKSMKEGSRGLDPDILENE